MSQVTREERAPGNRRMDVGEDKVLEAKERMSSLPLNTKIINMWLKCLHLPAMLLSQLPGTQQALGDISKSFITIPTQNDWKITSCMKKKRWKRDCFL